MATQQTKVWEHLQKNGYITGRQMAEAPFYINASHAVIRDLRAKYGADTILDEWITKTRKEYDGNGKEHKVTIRYKKYFLSKMEGLG